MNNYRILTRLMIRNTLASMNPFAQSRDTGKKKGGRARAIALLLLAAYGIGFMLWIEFKMYGVAERANQPLMLPALAILISMMLTLMLGLFQGLSELYHGKDAPLLAALPVTSRQIYAAKLTTLAVFETAVNALVALPAFALYIVRSGKVMPSALMAIPVCLLLSILPLSAAVLLSALLMRISGFARHRETVTMVLSLALVLGYSIFISRLNSATDADADAMLASMFIENGTVERFTRMLPPAGWAARAFEGNGWSFLLLTAVSAAAAALVIGLLGPGYMRQALSAGEKTVSARKSRSDADMRSRSALRALHQLEWRRLLRTPSWLMNGLAGLIVFPVALGVGLTSGFSGAGVTLAELVEKIPSGYTVCFGALLCAMGSMINPVVSTAVSREGSSWHAALSLPVKREERLCAKLLAGLEISAMSTLFVCVLLGILGQTGIRIIAAMLLLSLMIDTAVAAVSLWYDARHPHYDWANETEAIKRNFNQVWGMFFWLAAIALCCAPMFFCFEQPGLLAACMALIAGAETIGALSLLAGAAKEI